jgi:calcyclin binding protein
MESHKLELEADLQELKKLINETSSSTVKEYLMGYLVTLEQDLKSLPITTNESISTDGLVWKIIDTFAWDQDLESVKIYITSLENFKSHPKEKILLESESQSVCVSIVDFKGINYRLKFNKLCLPIQGSRISMRSNGFTLTLKKIGPSMWDSVEFKPKIVKEDKFSKSKNPADNLVGIMKEMYQTGDESVRKTISQAFEGRGKNSL